MAIHEATPGNHTLGGQKAFCLLKTDTERKAAKLSVSRQRQNSQNFSFAGDHRAAAHALDGRNVGREVAAASILALVVLAPRDMPAAGQRQQTPTGEGSNPYRFAGRGRTQPDPSRAKIAPVAAILRRMNEAHRQIQWLAQVAISQQEGTQSPGVDPFLIRDHHTKRAVGARLENDVRRRKQRAAGIGDDSGAANARAGGSTILRAQQRHGGSQGGWRRRLSCGRLRKRRAAQQRPDKHRENASPPDHALAYAGKKAQTCAPGEVKSASHFGTRTPENHHTGPAHPSLQTTRLRYTLPFDPADPGQTEVSRNQFHNSKSERRLSHVRTHP